MSTVQRWGLVVMLFGIWSAIGEGTSPYPNALRMIEIVFLTIGSTMFIFKESK